jgi:hypothetical protein
MNRALRIGDHVEFRDTAAADEFCRSSAYPELLRCMGGSQLWDEAAPSHVMQVVARRKHEGLPVLEVALSWTQKNVLVWAAHMRLDNRARRTRFTDKIAAMKVRRMNERRRRPK